MGTAQVDIRVMRPDEFEAMREVSVAAFGDSGQIRDLLDQLRASWAWEDSLSFVAVSGGAIVGQVLYTHSILDAPPRLVDVLVLSPVGVLPALHGHGIGSRLITESLLVLRGRDEPLVFLEGHPNYYPRFGFRIAADDGFSAPSVRTPREAFMVHSLPSAQDWMTGQLVYPDAFWRTDAVGLR